MMKRITKLLAEKKKLESMKATPSLGKSTHNCIDLELKRVENTLKALGYNKD